MSSHDPFGHLKHKLWPKERSGVKLAVWLPTIKSRESTWFPCMWHTIGKDLNEGYNFASDLISIRGLHAKLWGPKVTGVLTLGISGLPNGSLGTKCHLDVGLVERHKVYYKGEGDGFPQVQAVVNFLSPSCPWFVLAPKVLQLCTNHLMFGFAQVQVSSWCLSLFLVPSQSSTTPLYHQSATSQGACPDSLLFCCFLFRLTFESIKELGAHHLLIVAKPKKSTSTKKSTKKKRYGFCLNTNFNLYPIIVPIDSLYQNLLNLLQSVQFQF